MTLPPLELSPPDLQRYRDTDTGVAYVHRFDSGRPGPVVMVQALTHGNELCGAIALDWLFRTGLGRSWLPLQGQLIVSFANVAAYERFDAAQPFASRCVDEDLNRVWDDAVLFGPRDSVELRRARELQPFIDSADYLLDIHSMQEACRPLMLCGPLERTARWARQLGTPANLLLDAGHAAGRRLRDRGGFADPDSPRQALLIECGQHWERRSVDVAIDTLLRFLQLTGVQDAAWVSQGPCLPLPPAQQLIRVDRAITARSEQFRFLVPAHSLDVIPAAGTPIAQDGETVIRTEHAHTVLVMPSRLPPQPGQTMVRLGTYAPM